MDTRTKYPRTFHLPWSPGSTSDDKVLVSTDHFVGQEVVVTEKLDGECTTMYPGGYLHARSLDSTSHPSQSWCRSLAARVGQDIPKGFRVCGENVFARHSIGYDRLPSYFLVFGIYEDETCLSWDSTVEWCELLGLTPAPVLYRGQWDEDAIKAAFDGSSAYGDTGEGYVVRVSQAFRYEAFSVSLAKWVRSGHVQTDTHWKSQAIVPNGLKS